MKPCAIGMQVVCSAQVELDLQVEGLAQQPGVALVARRACCCPRRRPRPCALEQLALALDDLSGVQLELLAQLGHRLARTPGGKRHPGRPSSTVKP